MKYRIQNLFLTHYDLDQENNWNVFLNLLFNAFFLDLLPHEHFYENFSMNRSEICIWFDLNIFGAINVRCSAFILDNAILFFS